MKGAIHPSAFVEDGARLGAGVEIGPFCHVGPQATLGDGVRLISHVSLAGDTDDRRAHAHLSLRLDRPSAAGPQIPRRAGPPRRSARTASFAKA